jgi:pyrrolidone-carboxylate peptidase
MDLIDVVVDEILHVDAGVIICNNVIYEILHAYAVVGPVRLSALDGIF